MWARILGTRILGTRILGAGIMALGIGTAQAGAAEVTLYAAGSLKAALGEVAQRFSEAHGTAVTTQFGPSGLMRERIEAGEPAQVFASANMRHPALLEAAGLGGPVTLFARNKLCALAAPGLAVTGDTLLDVMLREEVKLGTSTPKADPSGDYAFALFEKTGQAEALKAKSLQLTGGPESAKAPAGRNTYAWVVDSGQADLFLTYCTNAVLAQKEVAGLQIVQIPEALSVGADYGLIVLGDAAPDAAALAEYILSEPGQAVLGEFGFETVTAR